MSTRSAKINSILEGSGPTEDDLRWLLWAVTNAPVWATSDAALLAALESVFPEDNAQLLLKELESRLEVWPLGRHQSAAAVLTRLQTKHHLAGREAQWVDRATLRLLPRLRGTKARELARACLNASRLLRRRAAWRYFTLQGSQNESIRTLERAHPEKDKAFLEWLTVEPRLVRFLELDVLLRQIPSFYWRARILATAFRSDRDAVARIAARYPAETLTAVRWSNSTRELVLIRDILSRHGNDVSVVTEAIRAFATFHSTADLEHALAVGSGLLERDPLYSRLLQGEQERPTQR
jgi:hypothetical protein